MRDILLELPPEIIITGNESIEFKSKNELILTTEKNNKFTFTISNDNTFDLVIVKDGTNTVVKEIGILKDENL